MSCLKNVQRSTVAAVKCGISRRTSQAVFFAGTYLGAIMKQTTKPFRAWRQRQRPKTVKRKRFVSPKPLPVLPGIEQVRPISVDKLVGKCTQCGNPARESPGGNWYQIKASQYCPNCVQDKAKAENVALLPTGSASSDTVRPTRYTPRMTTLRPKLVSVGSVKNIQGHSVRCLGRDTGLSLVPDVTMQAGQVKVDSSKWFITYDKAGETVGGPFANIKQAQAMASLLANFDWTRSPSQFTPAEVQQAGAMARQQRGELGYYQDQEQRKRLEGLWS